MQVNLLWCLIYIQVHSDYPREEVGTEFDKPAKEPEVAAEVPIEVGARRGEGACVVGMFSWLINHQSIYNVFKFTYLNCCLLHLFITFRMCIYKLCGALI